MTALIRMRLIGFGRTGRAFAPLLAGLVVLGVLYGGGRAQPAEAYGVSAVVMFPVLAWQTKLLLDAEPDVQRRIALVAVGSPAREAAAGLLAGAVAALLSLILALVVPWLVGGMSGQPGPGARSLAGQVAVGAWALLLAVPPAVLLGALASRAVTAGAAWGLTVLAVGVVATLVLGLKGSVAPWLAPPAMASARAASSWAGGDPDPLAMLRVTGHGLAWTGVAVLGYGWLRRRRT